MAKPSAERKQHEIAKSTASVRPRNATQPTPFEPKSYLLTPKIRHEWPSSTTSYKGKHPMTV